MSTHSRAGRFGPHPSRQPAGAALLLLSLVMLGLPVPSLAVPGDLDPTFNSDGIPGFDLIDFNNSPDEARAVVTQPDGKIVVAGYTKAFGNEDFALVRYNPDGNLDPSFDLNGIVITNIGGNERINALVQQPDGKLVAAGFTDAFGDLDIAVVRYNVDGSLDAGFDGNGLALSGFVGNNDGARAVIVQPDGKLVVAGFTVSDTGELDIALARFNPDGSPDNTFDGNGFRCCFYRGNDAARAVELQRDGTGRLVVAGFTDFGGSRDFLAVRLNQDGSLDGSFFGGGTFISIGTNRSDEANDLVLQPDGRVVMAGSSSDGVESFFALLRLNPDGLLDRSFGFDGGVLTTFGPGSFSIPFALHLQPDGKLVEAGTSLFFGSDVDGDGILDGDIDFALVRHNSDGSLDPTFGFGGGTLTLLNSGSADFIFGLAAQPDGNLVATGTSIIPGNPASFNFAVARYEVGPIGRQSARSERLSSRALTPGSVSCKGQPVTILGTPGDDLLRGTIGDDVIHGMGGNDQIFGFDGNDIICGGTGKDRLVGGMGNDRLLGQRGNDRLFGQAGRDNMDGGPGRDDRCNPGPGGRRSLKGCETRGGLAPAEPTPPPPRRFHLDTIAGGATASPPSIRSSAGTGGFEIRGLSEAEK